MKYCRLNNVFICLTIIALAAPSFVAASDNTTNQNIFSLSAGIESMTGDATTRIGGTLGYADGSTESLHFPVSELEWPLDALLGRIDAGAYILPSLRINGMLKTDMSDPDDRLVYKDWVTPASPGRLDIYSESDISSFDALIVDVDVEWLFLQRETWSVYAGLGYQHQNFEYDAVPLYQYSPSGLPGLEYYGDGTVGIMYELTHSMPYALIGMEAVFAERFALSGSFAFAPWVDAEDKTTYVYSNSTDRGDMDGQAYLFDLSCWYSPTPAWHLAAGVQYTRVDLDGTMKFAAGSGPVTADEKTESSQFSVYAKAGFSF